MRFFPFTLRDKAKDWLESQEPITIWDILVGKFLGEYFPPAKIAKLWLEINNFVQKDEESDDEAWEKYRVY